MNDNAKKILVSLQAQCAKREYCSADILRKATLKLEGDKALAQEILESLLADKFVDNLRFATAFCSEKASINGWGPIKIRRELLMRGIESSVIAEAMGEVDVDKASGRLLKLLQTKWKTLEGDPQAKLKLLRFALSRGYEYSAIEACLPEVLSKQGDC